MTPPATRRTSSASSIDTNTKISISILIILLGMCGGVVTFSVKGTRWVTTIENRMTNVETLVMARPDPWSGAMEKEVNLNIERKLHRYHPDYVSPDIRAIQLREIRLAINKGE